MKTFLVCLVTMLCLCLGLTAQDAAMVDTHGRLIYPSVLTTPNIVMSNATLGGVLRTNWPTGDASAATTNWVRGLVNLQWSNTVEAITLATNSQAQWATSTFVLASGYTQFSNMIVRDYATTGWVTSIFAKASDLSSQSNALVAMMDARTNNLWTSTTNWVVGQRFVTASITNDLASTGFVIGQGYLTASSNFLWDANGVAASQMVNLSNTVFNYGFITNAPAPLSGTNIIVNPDGTINLSPAFASSVVTNLILGGGLGGSIAGADLTLSNTFVMPSGIVTNSTAFNVGTNGNVGIGTTTPVFKFDVRGDAVIYGGTTSYAEGFNVFYTGTSDYGGGMNYHLGAAGAVPSVNTLKSYTRIRGSGTGTRTGNLVFGIYGGAIGEQQPIEVANATGNVLLAQSVGNVGIGTTDPQTKLDVAGDVRASSLTLTNGSLSVSGDATISGTLSVTNLNVSGTGTFSSISLVNAYGTDYPNKTFYFGGYTWVFGRTIGLNDGEGLKINGSEAFNRSDSTETRITGPHYADGSPINFYNGVNGGLMASISSNGISLGSNTNWSASVVTNGTSFFVGTNGNVGIGTTDPQTKLDVAGDVRASSLTLTNGNLTMISGSMTNVLTAEALGCMVTNLTISSASGTWLNYGTAQNPIWSNSTVFILQGATNAQLASLELNGSTNKYGLSLSLGDDTGHNEFAGFAERVKAGYDNTHGMYSVVAGSGKGYSLFVGASSLNPTNGLGAFFVSSNAQFYFGNLVSLPTASFTHGYQGVMTGAWAFGGGIVFGTNGSGGTQQLAGFVSLSNSIPWQTRTTLSNDKGMYGLLDTNAVTQLVVTNIVGADGITWSLTAPNTWSQSGHLTNGAPIINIPSGSIVSPPWLTTESGFNAWAAASNGIVAAAVTNLSLAGGLTGSIASHTLTLTQAAPTSIQITNALAGQTLPLMNVGNGTNATQTIFKPGFGFFSVTPGYGAVTNPLNETNSLNCPCPAADWYHVVVVARATTNTDSVVFARMATTPAMSSCWGEYLYPIGATAYAAQRGNYAYIPCDSTWGTHCKGTTCILDIIKTGTNTWSFAINYTDQTQQMYVQGSGNFNALPITNFNFYFTGNAFGSNSSVETSTYIRR